MSLDYDSYTGVEFKELTGQVCQSVVNVDNESIHFTTVDNVVYRLEHIQDCCECVSVDDICGDLEDLVGNPIVQAEEFSNDYRGPKTHGEESFTWTFYKLATIKGSVTIRWYGSSNGYYSESVSFFRMK